HCKHQRFGRSRYCLMPSPTRDQRPPPADSSAEARLQASGQSTAGKNKQPPFETPEPTSLPKAPTANYAPALDGIRALAVTAVMVTHAFPQYAGGGYGVDVFFCLSGFLITS